MLCHKAELNSLWPFCRRRNNAFEFNSNFNNDFSFSLFFFEFCRMLAAHDTHRCHRIQKLHASNIERNFISLPTACSPTKIYVFHTELHVAQHANRCSHACKTFSGEQPVFVSRSTRLNHFPQRQTWKWTLHFGFCLIFPEFNCQFRCRDCYLYSDWRRWLYCSLHNSDCSCIFYWCSASTVDVRLSISQKLWICFVASFAWRKTLKLCLLISSMEVVCERRLWLPLTPYHKAQTPTSDIDPSLTCRFSFIAKLMMRKSIETRFSIQYSVCSRLTVSFEVRTETMSRTFINRVRWIISIAFNLADRNNVYDYLSCACVFFSFVDVFSSLHRIH